MKTWLIEPRDPLIVRDGRPFGPTPGVRAASLSFPFPSTTTGGVRTRAGLDAQGTFAGDPAELRKLTVKGPVLVELDPRSGEVSQWLAPRPADALLLEEDPPTENAGVLRRLLPLKLPEGASTNLPDGLQPVGLPKPDLRKPHSGAPRFWQWCAFKQWLTAPCDEQPFALADLGHNGPVPEERMHVSIQKDTQTNAEGALFQTRGLEFTGNQKPKLPGKRLALAVVTNAANLKPGIAPLGGERRLMQWRESKAALSACACPKAVRETVAREKHCRVVLLTPAHFSGSWKPAWLFTKPGSVTPTLQAMAVGRPDVVSGWDFVTGKAKPTRRLAPAGTVLFLKLAGTDDAVGEWVDTTWMSCLSDEEQDRRDGFGLAVLGTWDGVLRNLEVTE